MVQPANKPAPPPVEKAAIKRTQIDIDQMLIHMLELRGTGKQMLVTELQMRELCLQTREVFMRQSALVELNAPLNIMGDIHGQFDDLLEQFHKCGHLPLQNYLFLGDYVDRGKKSLECVVLLFAYKIKFPENLFLLRGNHECASINRIYGFYDECKRRFSIKLWKHFVDVFNVLPIGIVHLMLLLWTPLLVRDRRANLKCLCTSLVQGLESKLRDIERPCDVPETGVMCDLLWSDPDEDITGWGENDRGVSFTFGADVIRQFLVKHQLSLVVRGHQVVEDGYQFFAKRKLVTLFSAPNYCGEFDNAAAVMHVAEDLTCSFTITPPSMAIHPVVKTTKK